MTDRFEIIVNSLLNEIPVSYASVVHDGEYVSEGYTPDRVRKVRGLLWLNE